jgi:L-ascorbate metabolism protein UlaG (beta-lactamase superfamily)
MKITYYGHSCFSVQVADKHLLFDPFITPNPAAKAIDINSIPADYMLITHGHEDHIADAVAIAQRTRATVISNYEIIQWLGKKGVTNGIPMNHGGSRKFDFGSVKYVNAIHSSVLPDGSYGGNPGGFVITTASGNFYYSGDTALTMDMKLIGESTSLAFAALCIGDNFTMGVDDALKAAQFIHCDHILGVHYDTFPQIKIDRAAAAQAFKTALKTLHLPEIGATLDM